MTLVPYKSAQNLKRTSLPWKSLSVIGLLALGLTGCMGPGGSFTSSSSHGGTSTGTTGSFKATIGGSAFGGKQAIYNATVTLYAMNTTTANYGDTPTQYAQVTTGFNGGFSFTKGVDGATSSVSGAGYSCPATASSSAAGTAGNPEMYLVASGGDTSGAINAGNVGSAYNNTASKLILAIGDCNSLSAATHVSMNEVTTVGTMVALQQFFNPLTESIGAPTTNISGLTNSVAMIDNLVDRSAGYAQQSTSPASTVPGVTMTLTSEYQKLNTMANILAACVSSTSAGSSACTTLKNSAVPPASAAVTNFPSITTYPDATDTLLAADYMSINPTQSQDYAAGSGKLFNLYSLSTLTSPFQPALTAQPMDWTVGINLVPSGTCSNLTTPVAPYSTFGQYTIIIDKDGSPWFGSWNSADILGKFSPTGGLINCLSPANGGNSAGRRAAIDSKGNIWWATSQGVLEYVLDPSNSKVGTFLTHAQPTNVKVNAVAADQNGNIFVAPDSALQASDGSKCTSSITDTSDPKYCLNAGYVYMYPNGASATANIAAGSIQTLGSVSMLGTGVAYRDLIVNANGNMVAEGPGSTARIVYFYTNNSGTYTNKKLSPASAAVGTAAGMALDNDGNFVGGNSCCANSGMLYRLNGNDGTVLTHSGLTAGGQGGDYSLAVDGANNIWSGASKASNSDTFTIYALGETDANYNPLSPKGRTLTYAAGTVPWTPDLCGGTPSQCAPDGGFQKSWSIGVASQLAIDGSGNVWVAMNSGTPKNGIWMLVGSAVPVKTPVVNNLH